MNNRQNAYLTFKGNVGAGRHDWLRLTPAYSYQLVKRALALVEPGQRVLDPFAGTGTTGLAAAEDGLDALLLDINPFLIWFANAKTRRYDPDQVDLMVERARYAIQLVRENPDCVAPIPPMHRITRWWEEDILSVVAALRFAINKTADGSVIDDLVNIAFCRVMISQSNAAFNHQSMSFSSQDERQPRFFDDRVDDVLDAFNREVSYVAKTSQAELLGTVAVSLDDSRTMRSVSDRSIDILYTSPPYANRMSYIRELRPYMYWLGYLTNSRQAGELDWRAIGGTWGMATSMLANWHPSSEVPLGDEFRRTLSSIAGASAPNGALLSRYVHKYFADVSEHLRSAYRVIRSGGSATYVVGNSTFYGIEAPTEQWYADLLSSAGFQDVTVSRIRKRNSKKELYEFEVRGYRP